MAGRDEFGLRLAGDQVLLEGDAGIAIEHRIGAADQAIAFLQDRRHPRDFEAALFAFGDAAAQHREGFAEERADEMRLKAARLRPLHLLADFADGVRVHALRRELALGDQLLDRVHVDSAVHLAEELRLLLRPIAVADRIDQKIAQSVALEQFAENVVDLAAERRARLFQLLKQAAIDLAFARVGRAQVPEVTDFRLTDAVDAAEALFNSVRIPRQVIVDHEVRAALKVHAFAGGVVRDHHADDRVGIEGGDSGAPGFSCDAAVNHDHGSRVANAGRSIFCCRYSSVSLGSVKIRIFRRSPVAGSSMIGSSRIDFQLTPLGVLPGKLQAERAIFEVLQNCDLGFEFGERLRGGRLIEDLLLRPPLLRRRGPRRCRRGRRSAALAIWRAAPVRPAASAFLREAVPQAACVAVRASDGSRPEKRPGDAEGFAVRTRHSCGACRRRSDRRGSSPRAHRWSPPDRDRPPRARAHSSPYRRGVRETAACRRTDRVPPS